MQSANTMISAANQIVADPVSQQAIKETLNSLPKLVGTTRTAIDETRQTVVASRQVLESMNRNLVNLSQVTEPVGKRGEQMVAKLDSSLTNIDLLLTELNRFARVVNQKDGSLQKLVHDPSLYDNLDRSSQSICGVDEKSRADFARPAGIQRQGSRETLNFWVWGGAVRPSTGLKDEENSGRQTDAGSQSRPRQESQIKARVCS